MNKYPSNPIALVEAPKTAIYGTLYFGLPETNNSLIWLAVYNKSSFAFDKLKALQGRYVYVFPDLSKDGSTFKEWETKAKTFQNQLKGTKFILSDLLEQLAPETDKSKGNDIADYLIKQDWQQFRKRNIKKQPPQPEPEQSEASEQSEAPKTNIFSHTTPLPQNDIITTDNVIPITKQPPKNWNSEITVLEYYFSNTELPQQPVKLNVCSTITDCSKFIESHFATIKANNGKRLFLPFLNRLQELKQVLESN